MIELAAEAVVAVVDPEGGGRIARLAVGGRDLFAAAGCFLMAPWAGRTGNAAFGVDGRTVRLPPDDPPHAIHGTVRGVAWRVEEVDAASVRLSCTLGPSWPWRGWCEHVVTVLDDHLELEALVHAVDDGPSFPAVLGWHPWFAKPAVVLLDADAMLERGDDHLPTGLRVTPAPHPGDRPFDDCFEGVRWPVVLRWGDGFEVRVDAEGCGHVVLFDELPATTCVEPQTAPPNALNTGEAAAVEPGHPLRATMRIAWR